MAASSDRKSSPEKSQARTTAQARKGSQDLKAAQPPKAKAAGQVAQNRPGMGALPHEGGVSFRVWAPHADAVWVMGDFNDWSKTADPLRSEGNGYWYGDIAGARAGQEYKYLLRNGETLLERIDPYARQVTHSVGHGVIYDPDSFDWQGDDFRLAPHNELVIYEMHIGSFHVEEKGRPGGFDTVLKRLDHLVKLGVNAIQIMLISGTA